MSILRNVKKAVWLAVFAVSSLQAQVFDGSGFGEGDCCPGPLCPCAIGLQAKGGIAPTFFTDPDATYSVVPALFPGTNPIVLSDSGQDFDNVFDLPWLVGGELSYNATDHVQLFLEGMYRQGDAKNKTFTSILAGFPRGIKFQDDFRTWGLYVGGRYFLNRWDCLCIAPFIGAKIGFQQYDHINAIPFIVIDGVSVRGSSIRVYESNYALSVGIQAGFDYAITECLSLVFTVEGVFTSLLRPNHNAAFEGTFGLTNTVFGNTGTDISVPITLGLRWDF